MRILKCSCCGSDVTMPSFKDGKPYGFSCFKRLFGKSSKPAVYVPVEVTKVIRSWFDMKDFMEPSAWEAKKDQFTVYYLVLPTLTKRKVVSGSEFAIKDEEGNFWVTKNEVKAEFLKSKINLTSQEKLSLFEEEMKKINLSNGV